MNEPRLVTTILELLAERWPSAFSIYEARRRPLKIGIHLDILAALDGAVTPGDLGCALRVYVGNRVYRSRLVAGAARIGLDGEPAGIVSEAEAAGPATARSAMKAPPAKTTSGAPKRISLADLRAAAAARKAVMS
jgi:ProP effector